MIIGAATGVERDAYIFVQEREISREEEEAAEKMLRRRLAGEPMAYILGEREFYNSSFLVSPAVLIPRPETETLVELAISADLPDETTFADFGCGSGCAGLSVALEKPRWRGVLMDNSRAALAVARENGARLTARARYIAGDIFAPPFRRASLDLVISNPPYICESEKNEVCAETLAYEPASALFSPKDGFAHIMALIRAARYILRENGLLAMEHGYRQQDDVARLLADASFDDIRRYEDLAGLPRCVTARKTRG